MRRIHSLAVAAAALASALGAVPAATATPAATEAPTVISSRAAYDCTPGHFCIYSEPNGEGMLCQWSQPSTAETAANCPFINWGQNVGSVRNATGHLVQYYKQANYRTPAGPIPHGAGGNLEGSYQIRSFKPL
ncbi:peptidase inhibitor family I36 protein [Streptomyces sp. BA2]|uniref:peptidase inhibitor family I36 protein n=1 Tax=Streptomyces sp. BA2 TaxID=436595 RepID=UPI0013277A14|nr:peptidase inhibitor family I36 protein [Streptomyces sp. BA2]MWA11700.1 peptidase inhibitor [Streptomyces sp. BA2]